MDNFIGVMEILAAQIEREKRDAIIVSNELASLPVRTEQQTATLRVRTGK